MHKIEYYILLAVFWIFNHISISSGKRVALVFYFLVAKVFRYRKKVILENLYASFGPDLPFNEKGFLKAVYKNFVFLWMEFLQANHLHEENINEHFEIHNIKVLNNCLAGGKGALILSGHFGNFEWCGQLVGILGHPVAGIAKRQSNPYVNELVERNRTRNNVKVIYTKNAIRNAIQNLNKNEIIAIVADQDAGKRGIFVDFMGRPSSTAVGPAIIHLRSGAPMLLIISVRRDYAKFDVYFEEIYNNPDQEMSDELIREITEKHTNILEKWVRKYPEQWFWMHRRWKTQPGQ